MRKSTRTIRPAIGATAIDPKLLTCAGRLQVIAVARNLGAILSVVTDRSRDVSYYRERLASVPSLSHLTVEVDRAAL